MEKVSVFCQDSEHDGPIEDSDVVYIPKCANELKPYVGRKFTTLKEGEQCYARYGATCGFDVRMGTIKRTVDGTILFRYVLCNREGEKNVCDGEKNVEGGVLDVQHANSSSKIRRMSCRLSCNARVVLRFCGGESYVVTKFIEAHTHPLVSDSFKQFMKINRKLDYAHQNFILNCAKANIGLMRSFRLFKELVGSYENIGCSSLEFKNFNRDLRAFVVGVDAQILLNDMEKKRDTCSGFTFDYCVDAADKLKRLFWADSISIKNYHIFGDAVSFDATYSTNRYNMIFAPFTGKDNHGKCVTFAAGLLSKEDVESYSWIFEKFLKCMGKSPTVLITDQDPAMKYAIEQVMPDTHHRFCMWHIMLKVADKLPSTLQDDEVFAKKFNEIVWSEYLQPLEFQKRWTELMNEFGLSEHRWFSSLFALRSFWIPAYFKDINMGGLFRTTSLSESENSFFRRFFNQKANLCAFFMHFGSALDAQRHTHAQFSSKDESNFPSLQTKLSIEKHAASVYTHNIFRYIQQEIVAAVNVCCIIKMTSGDDVNMYKIDDNRNGVFTVTQNVGDNYVSCECNKFITKGLICQHMFLIFKNMKLQSIPERYIIGRWTKLACHGNDGLYNNIISSIQGSSLLVSKQIFSEVYKCIRCVDGKVEHLEQLLVDLRGLTDKYSSLTGSTSDGNGKQKLFENYYGSTIPETISVLPPDPVKTKGSGSRLKSRKEKALLDMNKPMRRCRGCNQMTNHDKRNCPASKTKGRVV